MKISLNTKESLKNIYNFSLQGTHIKYLVNEPTYFALHYALKNNFYVFSYANDENYEIPEGSFFIAKEAKDYALLDSGENDCIIISFLIRNPYLHEAFYKFINEKSEFDSFLKKSNSNYAIPKVDYKLDNQKSTFEAMLYSLFQKENGYTYYNIKYLELLVKQIIIYLDYSFLNQLNTSPIVSDILDYINTNISTANLKEFAKQANYSPSYISEIVHRETGHTFSQILYAQRMKKSKELLTNTTAPLQFISESVGYQNASSFIAAFHETYKITPNEFRKNVYRNT